MTNCFVLVYLQTIIIIQNMRTTTNLEYVYLGEIFNQILINYYIVVVVIFVFRLNESQTLKATRTSVKSGARHELKMIPKKIVNYYNFRFIFISNWFQLESIFLYVHGSYS